jgi:cystathionine beta-lyase
MWVADMDFASPKSIQELLKREAEIRAYGYEALPIKFYDSIIAWYQKRHNIVIEKEWIVPIPSVITALGVSIKLWGDGGVLIQPPVYEQFDYMIKLNRAKKVSNPLINEGDKYKISYPLPKASVALFCSPQNPTGRVWSKQELEEFAKAAKRHDMVVVSDEIHSDIVFNKFYSMIDFYDKVVLVSAVNKTFNVAKYGGGYAIIKNEALREEFKAYLESLHLGISPTSAKILIEAYKEDEWVDALKEVLTQNMDYIEQNLTPKIKRVRPEGTYLLWLDFSDFGLSDRELREKMVNEAKLGLNSGTKYGREGTKHMRLNFATSLENIKEAVERLNRVFG